MQVSGKPAVRAQNCEASQPWQVRELLQSGTKQQAEEGSEEVGQESRIRPRFPSLEPSHPARALLVAKKQNPTTLAESVGFCLRLFCSRRCTSSYPQTSKNMPKPSRQAVRFCSLSGKNGKTKQDPHFLPKLGPAGRGAVPLEKLPLYF